MQGFLRHCCMARGSFPHYCLKPTLPTTYLELSLNIREIRITGSAAASNNHNAEE
jgi:hypothetical protein